MKQVPAATYPSLCIELGAAVKALFDAFTQEHPEMPREEAAAAIFGGAYGLVQHEGIDIGELLTLAAQADNASS